jgi:hypothetical protein
MKYWEIIADNLKKAGWSWGCSSQIDSTGQVLFTADAYARHGTWHRGFRRTVVKTTWIDFLHLNGIKEFERATMTRIGRCQIKTRTKRERADAPRVASACVDFRL